MGTAGGIFKDGPDLGKWGRMWKGVGRKQKKQDFEVGTHLLCSQ